MIMSIGKKINRVFVFTIALLLLAPASAFAACCICSDCDSTMIEDPILEPNHDDGEIDIMEHFVEEMIEHRDWITDDFMRNNIPRTLMRMTEQMSAVAMHQAQVLGTLLDAKHQLETQRLFNELQNEAHRDYQPSDDFCWFGTNVRSLAHSESRGKQNATALSERSMARQLGSLATSGSLNRDEDLLGRWNQFIADNCDSQDNNWSGGVTGMVQACGANRPPDQMRANRDIDYTRLIDEPRTINLDLLDGAPLPADGEEEDVIAMANYLYGHRPLSRAGDALLKNSQGQNLYLALRSIAARRSVAENSFDTIVGMKSAGTSGSPGSTAQTREFLAAILAELGVADENGNGNNADEIYGIIGERPSYYAQLEILAKKIYQNPDFYSSLYDSPANIARKAVALKAIELMLERAMYESETRQEMLMSVLLSSENRGEFRDINKDMLTMGGK
jgi:hypothetical protein